MDNFDPYHKWLGIPPKDQPPTYYRLLGLETFEADPDVISLAAERQIAHVRQLAIGPHAERSQQILDELARAKATLLDHRKKAEYDAMLRGRSAAQGQPPRPAGRTGASPPSEFPNAGLASQPNRTPGTSSLSGSSPSSPAPGLSPMVAYRSPALGHSSRLRPERQLKQAAAAIAVAVAVVVLGLAFWIFARGATARAPLPDSAENRLASAEAQAPPSPETPVESTPESDVAPPDEEDEKLVASAPETPAERPVATPAENPVAPPSALITSQTGAIEENPNLREPAETPGTTGRASVSGPEQAQAQTVSSAEGAADGREEPPLDKLDRRLVATWRISYPNGAVRTYVIKDDGAVLFLETRMTGKLDENLGTLDFGDGKLERILLVDGKLLAEHFANRSDYGKKPPDLIGHGVQIRPEQAAAQTASSAEGAADGREEPPLDKLDRRLVGTWRIWYSNRAVRTYVIKDNGEVLFLEEGMTGKLDENLETLDFGDGKLERLTLVDGKLLTERFVNRSDYGKKPPDLIGRGVRIRPEQAAAQTASSAEGAADAPEEPPLNKLDRRLVATWRISFSNRAVRTYVIKDNGAVLFVEQRMTGKLDEKLGTLDFGDGKLERLTLIDGKLLVEHFPNRSDYEKKPPAIIGRGVRVRR